MKVLLDSCVTGLAVDVVRQAGHDVVWVGDWPRDPGDEQILQVAANETRVLVTIDKGFGELILVQGRSHAGLIRLIDFRAAEQGPAVVRLLSTYPTELAASALLTADASACEFACHDPTLPPVLPSRTNSAPSPSAPAAGRRGRRA